MPGGEGEEVAEEEGAGDGVVEGVVGLAVGEEVVEFVCEVEGGDEVGEGFGFEGGVGVADEAEGVEPFEGVEGRDVLEEVALGGDVVGDEDAVLEAGEEFGPEVVGRWRNGELGAELGVASGGGGVEGAVGSDAEQGFPGGGREEGVATEVDEADLPGFAGMAGDGAGGFEIEGDKIHC